MAYICELNWHITPMREQRWLESWAPAAERMDSFGATSWTIYRSADDPLLFRQVSTWEDKADFERYWYSDEVIEIRESIIDLYDKPLLPSWNLPVLDG